jgi:hypothetical protein
VNNDQLKPNIAILDGDIIAYRAAFWADQEGSEWLESRLEDDIKRWNPFPSEPIIALSCRRENNFRRSFLPEYKEHRQGAPRPDCLKDAIQYLLDRGAAMSDTLEADDLIGRYKSSLRAVCVTIDKDLGQVPGYYWVPPTDSNPPSDEILYTDLATADRFFYRQWITGDSTDNIAGIWKMGPKKAEAALDSTSPNNHTALVLSLYETRKDRTGSAYSLDYAVKMAKAVRILRDGEGVDWDPLSLLDDNSQTY